MIIFIALICITGIVIGLYAISIRLFSKIGNYCFNWYEGGEEGIIKVRTVTDKEEQLSNKDKPLQVEVKDSKFDSSRIKEYEGKESRNFEFRPQTFSQFISQNEAKEQAKTIIKKANRNMKGHLFLSARQGTGKTTFIKLLANELQAKIITRVGKQLDDPEEIINIINEINTSPEKQIIFFIDEIDSLDKKIIKMLNPIVEQFEISNKKIKPFIFAGASINKDVLIKNNPDFLDRIGHHIHFKPYSSADIKKILLQYKIQLYKEDNVSEAILQVIAQSCKFCPRIGISLLEDFIVENNINKVFKNRCIIKNGLTETDIKILKVLNNAKKPMGANAVALRTGLTQKQYTEEFEPFLYEFEYINRIPSRILANKGKKLLNEINERKIS